MDADDLDYRARTRSGCIPPELVSQLLERGRADVVERQAQRGEWFCALAWARLLGERDRRADAMEVLAPFLATGWWTAVAATAELLERWGRAEEAIEILRARTAVGHPMALETYARLLARYGRAAEAYTLLVPHVDDPSLAAALVDVSGLAGRDEETCALLAARVRDDHHCEGPWCCRGLDPDTAIDLLATVRERQGLIDEALALLRRRPITRVAARLADPLARHGRIRELRALAAEGHKEAVRRLAELLEELGDVEGAIAAYGATDHPEALDPNSAYGLARLLARHGRGDEAIEVMDAQADAHDSDDWILNLLAELYLDHGRPADGLARLDALADRRGGEEPWDLYWVRLPLIAAHHGVDEAIGLARAHPEGTTRYAVEHIARLLADAGRTEEAVAALRPHARSNRHNLARHLVDLDRVEEALALFQHTGPRPRAVPTTELWSHEPPF